MAKTNFQNVDEYHNTFPSEVKERLNTVRNIIKETVPEAEEVISYQIPAYKYHGFLIYYSAYQSHISISHPFSDALLAKFSNELKKYKTSKAAIQFPNDSPLPTKLIKEIVEFRKRENIEKQQLKKK